MTGPLDLDAIEAEWLNQCGPCDFGMPYGCACASGDPRPVIASLVAELRAVRSEWDQRAAVDPYSIETWERPDGGPAMVLLCPDDACEWTRAPGDSTLLGWSTLGWWIGEARKHEAIHAADRGAAS